MDKNLVESVLWLLFYNYRQKIGGNLKIEKMCVEFLRFLIVGSQWVLLLAIARYSYFILHTDQNRFLAILDVKYMLALPTCGRNTEHRTCLLLASGKTGLVSRNLRIHLKCVLGYRRHMPIQCFDKYGTPLLAYNLIHLTPLVLLMIWCIFVQISKVDYISVGSWI